MNLRNAMAVALVDVWEDVREAVPAAVPEVVRIVVRDPLRGDDCFMKKRGFLKCRKRK